MYAYKNRVNTQLSSILITFSSSSLNESELFDCFSTDDCSTILLLAPLDVHEAMDCEPLAPSKEFLGLSESGDLIDSHRGCFVSEALIDLGMHFDPPEVSSSLSSTESDCLQVLQIIHLRC